MRKPDPRNNWEPAIRLWEDPSSSSNEPTSSRRWVTTYFFGSIMWCTLQNPFAYSRIPRAPTLPVYFTRSCYVTYIRLIQQAIYSLHSDGNTMELLFVKDGPEHVGFCCKVMCRSQRLPCSILSRKHLLALPCSNETGDYLHRNMEVWPTLLVKYFFFS